MPDQAPPYSSSLATRPEPDSEAGRARASQAAQATPAPPPARPPEIVIVPYDSRWPELFRREVEALEPAFAQWPNTEFHHFGSTAVPGLMAKPVIDILVAVDDLRPSAEYEPKMLNLGYVPMNIEEIGRVFFHRVSPRSHHVHVVRKNSWNFWRQVLFRDELRSSPDLAARYAKLKTDMAQRFANDRDAYTNSKTEFIMGVQAAALRKRPELRSYLRDNSQTVLPD